MGSDRINNDDDRFFYENYLHKDYYADLPTRRKKTSPGATTVIWAIAFLLAIFCWDSPGVLAMYFLFVLSAKLSGVF